MDNSTNQSQQPNPSSQSSPDAPVFSSSNLTQTKARKDAQYFTNVQKATPWRRLSNWFNKVNRESLERSAARKAALKAKLDERRRAADLAAISAAVPTLPTSKSKFARPTAPAAQPTAPQDTAPTTQPPSITMPTSTAATAVPPATPAATPPITQPVATADHAPTTSTVIIENPPTAPKSRRPLIIILIAIIIIIIIGIILIIVQPWANNKSKSPDGISVTGTVVEFTTDNGEPVAGIDIATATPAAASAYQKAVLSSTTLNVYEDDINADMEPDASIVADNIDQVVALNGITDPAALLLFDIEKAYAFMIYGDYDNFFAIVDDIDEDSLYPSQQAPYYRLMCRYYQIINDEDKTSEYCEKALLTTFVEDTNVTTNNEGDSDEEL